MKPMKVYAVLADLTLYKTNSNLSYRGRSLLQICSHLQLFLIYSDSLLEPGVNICPTASSGEIFQLSTCLTICYKDHEISYWRAQPSFCL
ncbi:hypothetical protein KSS87_001743 [Heliosperma pusillum]|nr:hypothetical protein KSS87_001743 [Heliosperma pusillum]